MPALSTSYRSIVKLALPIIFGAFVQAILLYTDSYFISTYSREAFSAVGNAGLVFISIFMIGNGLADSGQIFMANRFGKDNARGLFRGFQSNLINLLVLGILAILLTSLISAFALPDLVKSEAIEGFMKEYLTVRAFGYVFSFATLAITSYFIALGRSMVMLYNTILLCTVNVIFDYLLIFGKAGFPALGVEGAAIASVIAEFVVMLFSLGYLLMMHRQVDSPLKQIKWYRSEGVSILKMAVPLMLQGFVATGAWTAYFFMIEQMGEFEIEVSQIIHKLYWLALIPMFGFAATTRTYVSNLLANQDITAVRKVVGRILIATYIFIFLFVHGNILYPDFWISLVYDPQVIDPDIRRETTAILVLITGSILIHTAAMVFQNVVAGAGDTLRAFRMEMISIVVYLTSAYYIIFHTEATIRQVWLAEYIYFGVFLLLTLSYYFRGRWQTREI